MLTLLAVIVTAAALSLSAAAYEVVAVPAGGALAGVVKFAGTAPRLEPLTVGRDHGVCGDRKDPEALVLGSDRGVRGGVILIEGVTRGKRSTREAVLDTQDCAFAAHVTALMTGDRARVRNADAILHHPHGYLGTATAFNLALPGREQTIDITRRLTRPGVIRVVCDAHPHMAAWLVVHDSPYYAVTDERGAYRIDGVPPGTYRVTMWHEGYRPRGRDRAGRTLYDPPRSRTKDVTIAPGATATADFELR